LYYCYDDPAWKDLSPSNLIGPISMATVKANYPTRKLHEPC
jgi:hypothetical protein